LTLERSLARFSAIRRVGYMSRRMRARVAPAGPGHRVLVTSMPKAGTHIVTTALDNFPSVRKAGITVYSTDLLGDQQHIPEIKNTPLPVDRDSAHGALHRTKQGQYVVSHLHHDPALVAVLSELDYRTIFVYRDPRDVVISNMHYIKRLRRHHNHKRFAYSFRTDKDRLLALIEGADADQYGPAIESIGSRLRTYAGWLTEDNVLPCRFEDIIGPAGGGTQTTQQNVIQEIANHIGCPVSTRQIEDITSKVWSPRSVTFRSGKSGEWRDTFDADVTAAFNRTVSSDILRVYGYDVD
jgi:hypothetical protein